jgi:hypothetical protein
MTAPVLVSAARHSWPHAGEPGYVPLHGSESPDGNDRTERHCEHCGLVKITVHPPSGIPWREWRTRDGRMWVGEATPPCLAQAAALKRRALECDA